MTNNRKSAATGRARARGSTYPGDAHDKARLAYLVELILEDPELADVHPQIEKATGHRACVPEDVGELSVLLESASARVGIPSALLALCVIQRAKEADLGPTAVEGSDDWFGLPPSLLGARTELRQKLGTLCSELEATFRGAGMEPERGIERALDQATELRNGIQRLLGEIGRYKGRRKRLFYSQTKPTLKAYYLIRIRKKPVTDRAFVQLFVECGEPFDLSIKDDIDRAKKRIHDAVDSVQELIDDVLRPYGVERAKRPYRKSL